MSQIQINDLTFTYENSYTPVFEHVSLQLDTNWKLGFTGRQEGIAAYATVLIQK